MSLSESVFPHWLPVITPRKGGVIELAKSNPVGPVSIKSLGSSKWMLRFKDPSTGRDVRRVLTGVSETEARAVVRHVTGELLSGKGFLPLRGKTCPTIREGIAEAIRLSRQRPETKRDSANRGALFIRWLAERFPRVTHWSDLKPHMIQEYVRDIEGRGLAPFTVRNHLRPVKQAWKHVHENYPDEVKALPSIRLAVSPRIKVDCLEAGELDALLGWLKIHARDLYTMGIIQALCGLRTMEAASLKRRDVDLVKGTIHVCSNEHHTLKNPGSERILPAPPEVIEALREWIDGSKVIRADGFLFENHRGNLWSIDPLSHRWGKKPVEAKDGKRGIKGGILYQAAEALNMPRLAQVEPHRLRSCFATMAGRLGVSDRLVKRYMGHSVDDVLGTHYEKVGLADLGEVSRRMEEWRSLFEREADWQNSGSFTKPISITG